MTGETPEEISVKRKPKMLFRLRRRRRRMAAMEAMKAIAAKAAMAAIDKKLATFEKSHPKVLQCSWGSGCRRHFEGYFSNSPIFVNL